jgi:hypothetical protein
VKGRTLAVALASLAVLVASASAAPRAASTTFVAWPDPRLCPSPLCGGWWAAAANRARTRCHDGLLRPRCYVAEVTRSGGGTAVPPGSLVRGTLETKQYGSIGELGVLAADAMWAPAGPSAAAGGFYRLRDLGIRCVRAPCFSYRAWSLNGVAQIDLSELDLAGRGATSSELQRARAALTSEEGLRAAGRIERAGDGGRVFRATRLYLRAPQPRA